jgi:hypothetical protein
VSGFRRALLKIEFGPDDLDGSLDGFWVQLARLSVDRLREITGLADAVKAGGQDEFALLVPMIGDALVNWNWCDPVSGEPVNARDQNAIGALDADVMMALLDKWQAVTVGVPEELGKESGSTPSSRGNGTSPAPIPVTGSPGLSAALARLPMLNESSQFSGNSPATH